MPLLSMTGFGSATVERPHARATVEVRSVNHRHLKLTVRGTEPYPSLEAEFEKLARNHLKRGSLLVQVAVHRPHAAAAGALNTSLLRSHVERVRSALADQPEFVQAAVLNGVLSLPGVAGSPVTSVAAPPEEWEVVAGATGLALTQLARQRLTEGEAMAGELRSIAHDLARHLDVAAAASPRIMGDYRARLLERVRSAVESAGVTLDASHLIRELALYADRTDVAEELTRITAHLAQLRAILAGDSADSSGRRLEFLAQELTREVNTLGSKAGDVELSKTVYDLKLSLERVKELIANVE